MPPEVLTALLRGEHLNMKERAAKYFLTWEHHLPGDLDGWRVARRESVKSIHAGGPVTAPSGNKVRVEIVEIMGGGNRRPRRT